MSNTYSGYAEAANSVGQINPMLVKLHHAHGLSDGAVARIDFEERVELCDEIIQLIEVSERPTDREMAADILITLLRQAEKELKQAIAERFSVMDKAPLRLILQFVNDEIDVAKPVLKYSKALNDLDLLYIIQSRDSPFWQAIAGRVELGENVIEALVDTNDVHTSRVLVENETVTLTEYALNKVVEQASEDEVLSEVLLARREIGEELARKLYAYASEAIKQSIEEKFGSDILGSFSFIDEVVSEFTEAQHSPFMPTASMLHAADLFSEQGKLTHLLMINTLKRGQIASFIAQFSRYVHLPVAVVVPMLQQKNGQSLAIACKANGINRQDFLIMFSCTRKIVGQDFAFSGEVSSALTFYDRVTSDVAKRLMNQGRH